MEDTVRRGTSIFLIYAPRNEDGCQSNCPESIRNDGEKGYQ